MDARTTFFKYLRGETRGNNNRNNNNSNRNNYNTNFRNSNGNNRRRNSRDYVASFSQSRPRSPPQQQRKSDEMKAFLARFDFEQKYVKKEKDNTYRNKRKRQRNFKKYGTTNS